MTKIVCISFFGNLCALAWVYFSVYLRYMTFMSDSRTVFCGVPQGTIFSFILMLTWGDIRHRFLFCIFMQMTHCFSSLFILSSKLISKIQLISGVDWLSDNFLQL